MKFTCQSWPLAMSSATFTWWSSNWTKWFLTPFLLIFISLLPTPNHRTRFLYLGLFLSQENGHIDWDSTTASHLGYVSHTDTLERPLKNTSLESSTWSPIFPTLARARMPACHQVCFFFASPPVSSKCLSWAFLWFSVASMEMQGTWTE